MMASSTRLMQWCLATFEPSALAVYLIDDIDLFSQELRHCQLGSAGFKCHLSGVSRLVRLSTFLSAAVIGIWTMWETIDQTFQVIGTSCVGVRLALQSINPSSTLSRCRQSVRPEIFRAMLVWDQDNSCLI